VQGSRSCTSAVYHQPAFDDNKFHQPRRSNFPSFNNHVVANKSHALSRLSRDLNPNVNSHCHLAEAKQASFHAKKKTNLFIYAKCKHDYSFVFLILQYSNVCIRL